MDDLFWVCVPSSLATQLGPLIPKLIVASHAGTMRASTRMNTVHTELLATHAAGGQWDVAASLARSVSAQADVLG